MTNKQTIDVLKDMLLDYSYASHKSEVEEAVGMAVSALKQSEQLETCPLYGGVCGYPSEKCYECPRHSRISQPEQKWTPCTIINQCYIPELKRIDYKGILFTYETITGKRLVKTNWIERGRIIGKQMNGTPVAYMPLPEPYAERRAE